MNYTKFKDFLIESEITDFSDLFYQSNKEILDNIIKLTPEDSEYLTELLDSLSEDDLDYLGLLLYFYFDEAYSDDDWLDDDVDYSFTTRDIIGLVYSAGTDALDAIDFILNYESDVEDELDIQVLFDKLDDYLEDSETLSEAGISKRMKITNMNKALKYMTNTKAKLRATAGERRKKNRKNRQKNRKNYRINKRKLVMYQKSRRAAIKKGKHQVKKRR